jgi:ABC-type transporter Mla subunit MlaD
MALLLLNCSVDTTGLFVDAIETKQIAVNDQESIIEILVEQFLGFDNLIPENFDDDMDQKASLKKAKVIDIFVLPNFSLPNNIAAQIETKVEVVSGDDQCDKFHFKIPSPPPEA